MAFNREVWTAPPPPAYRKAVRGSRQAARRPHDGTNDLRSRQRFSVVTGPGVQAHPYAAFTIDSRQLPSLGESLWITSKLSALAGGHRKDLRRHARAGLRSGQQTCSTEGRRIFGSPAMCLEATASIVNIIAIVSGRRDLLAQPKLTTKFSSASRNSRLVIS